MMESLCRHSLCKMPVLHHAFDIQIFHCDKAWFLLYYFVNSLILVILTDIINALMKNRHLAKAVAAQRFHHLLAKLKRKAEIIGIEFRMVDRFYPSSKICNVCGYIHKGLKLKDRVYVCPECGYTEDRDFNASLNLRDAKEYRVA